MEKLIELLPLIIPVIIIQMILIVYALIVLKNTSKVRGDSKLLWVFIIIFLNLIGPIVFLIYGRVENDISSEDV
ncbi:MAG: PLDc N-terminal domain-containing protein [Firmicutes bacterium]|nr:PLDc N-terminal domain-containing protein [Bacillota bacterium]